MQFRSKGQSFLIRFRARPIQSSLIVLLKVVILFWKLGICISTSLQDFQKHEFYWEPVLIEGQKSWLPSAAGFPHLSSCHHACNLEVGNHDIRRNIFYWQHLHGQWTKVDKHLFMKISWHFNKRCHGMYLHLYIVVEKRECKVSYESSDRADRGKAVENLFKIPLLISTRA